MTWQTNKGFSRRHFLGSLGAAAAFSPFIPLLNASGQELATPPKRLLLVFTPDGTAPSVDWMPQGTEREFTLRLVHQPLAPLQSKLVIPWGLRMSASGAGEQHAYGMAGQWTGSLLYGPQNGADFDGGNGNRTGWGSGPSIDQVVARAFGPNMPYQRAPDQADPEVPFRTLELGVQSGQPHSVNRMIYRDSEQPLHPETNPRSAFDRLFLGPLTNQDPDALARVRAEKRAVLDLVTGELTRLRTRVGSEEMQKIDNHAEALRAIERRLDTTGAQTACTPPTAPAMPGTGGQRPSNNELFPGEIQNMSEIVTQALACDLTRVASLQISRGFSNVTHTWLGQTVAHHTMSHDTSQDWNPSMEQIDNWYATQVFALLERMNSIPEGNGSLLDNTLVVWGRELGTTAHRMDPWPVVLAGSARGGLATGRFLQVGSVGTGNGRQREPSAKLLVSVARLMGLDINSFGNNDPDSGPLAGVG